MAALDAARARLAALTDPGDAAAAKLVLDKLDALAARGIGLMELGEAIDILRDQAGERDRRGQAAALVLADHDRLTGATPATPPPTGRTLPP